MNKGFVIIKQDVLQKLLDNFHEVCSLADEMDIYEFEDGDESMQEMLDWVHEKFGRTIDKENYE
jgi:hypothetical protein